MGCHQAIGAGSGTPPKTATGLPCLSWMPFAAFRGIGESSDANAAAGSSSSTMASNSGYLGRGKEWTSRLGRNLPRMTFIIFWIRVRSTTQSSAKHPSLSSLMCSLRSTLCFSLSFCLHPHRSSLAPQCDMLFPDGGAPFPSANPGRMLHSSLRHSSTDAHPGHPSGASFKGDNLLLRVFLMPVVIPFQLSMAGSVRHHKPASFFCMAAETSCTSDIWPRTL